MNNFSSASKILDLRDAIKQIQIWKKQEEKIVFTNGCFDLLHLGHIDYLEKAKNIGSKLIVGLNDDSSVRKLKGSHRPIHCQYARARVLAALVFVDSVVIFSEDTPYNLISSLIPDVLVKGNDYNIENIVGANIVLANGGKVQTINLTDNYSTTSIINRLIKK